MSEPHNLQLQMVQMIFRHGARTIAEAEAQLLGHSDPSICYPYGFDQLTDTGKQQMYKLGCTLRKRYANYLPQSYDQQHIKTFASDFDRTKMSMNMVLAGLYSEKQELPYNADINWLQTTNDIPSKYNDLLFKSHNTPRYLQILREFVPTATSDQRSAGALKTLKVINKHLINAFDLKPTVFASGVFGTLVSDKFMNKPLPEWCTEEIYLHLQKMNTTNLKLMAGTPELKKINAGPLMRHISDNVKNDPTDMKMVLYSGHDVNVIAVAESLGIGSFVAHFGCGIVIETFVNSRNEKLVRFAGWSGFDDDFFTIKLENQPEYLLLEEFEKIVESVLPTDKELEAIMEDMANESLTFGYQSLKS